MVTYGVTGTYTVTLTASNAAGSTAKTKIGFVIVTY
jgi:PKD repeat protein